MKISETTSYPHPVLAPWSADISDARFQVEIVLREHGESQQVDIHCKAELDQPELVALLRNGDAAFGCFITCGSTGFRRLQRFGFPLGSHQFAPGALLGRVQLRPMIWATRPIQGYAPYGAHPEFAAAFDIGPGQILALDDEQRVDVLRPPLPTIESIFEIFSSQEVEDGKFEIDLSGDRIHILTGEGTYALVQTLRQTDAASRAVAMNALFVPIVMQVLYHLSEAPDQYAQNRWYEPFSRRCELLEIDIRFPDLLTDAQLLLEKPFGQLACLAKDTEEDDE